MRIVLTASSLELGGAERATSHLANAWAARGDHVRVVTLLDDQSVPPFFALDQRVDLVRLDLRSPSRHLGQSLRENSRRARLLGQSVLRAAPDVVVAMTVEINIRTKLALQGSGVPVVFTERTDPRHYRQLRARWRLLRQLTYPLADALVVQTEAVRRIWPPWIRAHTRVIPNVVPLAALPLPDRSVSDGTSNRPRRIVGAGRLAHEKGFDLLIEAFASLAARHPDWHLEIIGEGPERVRLETLTDELGLRDRVRLPGVVADVAPRLAAADIFVLSSRFEGFPNVLCEAMAMGAPVCALDCPSGPAEIIEHGRDGLLVPPKDPVRLAEALEKLIGDPALRGRLGHAGRQSVQRFAPDRILALWDQCFEDVLTRRRRNEKGRNAKST